MIIHNIKMKFKILKFTLISILFICTTILIQSCALSAISSEPMHFKKETAQNGLIVGSITFPSEKARYNGYFIRITSIDSDEKVAKKNSTEIHISPDQIFKMKHTGQLDNQKTYLFAIERPEGNYEIPSIRLFTNSGVPSLQRTNYVGGFSIPFNVKKGEITYVGNIVFDEYANKDIIPVNYRNNFQKDINAIKIIQPYVDWDTAINDTNRNIDYNNKKVKK